FSSTVPGKPYALGEWLGEIALTLVFNAGGWTALVAFRALLAAVASFFLGRVSRAMGAPVVAALVVVVWTLALAKTRWTDRPSIRTRSASAVRQATRSRLPGSSVRKRLRMC